MRAGLVGLVTVVLASCAPTVGPPRPPPPRAATRDACPLGVAGATVVVEDTAQGIALLFRSASDESELRERVLGAAKMHGPFGRLGKGHDGRHGMGGEHGLQSLRLPKARADVTEIPGGARLSLVPADPGDLETLRRRVRARAFDMTRAPCDL